MVQPFDPSALPFLAKQVEASEQKVTALLQRKADRADSLREVAAFQGDEKAFKNALAVDKEVLAIIELVQHYKLLIQQHEADNASAWAMIALQDRRCEGFKQMIARRDKQFEQLRLAFENYVQRQQQAQ